MTEAGACDIIKNITKEKIMKYCTYCGTQIDDNAKFCSTCGKPTSAEFGNVVYHQENPKSNTSSNAKTLGKIAYAFMIVTIVSLFAIALYFIVPFLRVLSVPEFATIIWPAAIGCLAPLLWTIPMTVHLKKKLKANQPIGIGFKVCTLLFVNLVSGILLLCRNEENVGE